MKKIGTILICVTMLTTMLLVPAMAKGPVGEIVTISWLEDAERYDGQDNLVASWTDDPLGPADLVQTGRAYHFATIQGYYNYPLENLAGKLVISGSGRLSGHATYTSPSESKLPIRDRFKGEVTIEITNAGTGTMKGKYTQWSYAFGTWEEVSEFYNPARGTVGGPAKEKGAGWWLVGYTEYIAH